MPLTPTKSEQMQKAAAELGTGYREDLPRTSGMNRADEREAARAAAESDELAKSAAGEREPLTHFRHQVPTSTDLTGSITGDIRKAIHGEPPEHTPAEKMALEHLSLLRTFQQEEGRDPTPQDQEYWVAHNKIFAAGTADDTSGYGQ